MIPSPQPTESLTWSVSALVNALSDTLKARFSAISVQGEISGFSRASSGHCYFTLKDENCQIRCAMFQRAANMLSFKPANGDEVELRGRVAIYEQRGELQLIVESMRPVGQGRLLEQFQQLKAKLSNEGLFENDRKHPLPQYPQTIGIVSSLQAAALHDILTTLKRRAPHLKVIIYPTSVQGAQAANEIVKAIQTADARQEVDTLLVCRGGGSLEDLWSFNEEPVVRAIAACSIPIISGIGHETDFTLSDFAADLRAPTPTAAAEIAAQSQLELLQLIEQYASSLKKQLRYQLDLYAQRLDRAGLALRQPTLIIQAQKQKFEQVTLKFRAAFKQTLFQHNQTLTTLQKRWPWLVRQGLQNHNARFHSLQYRWQQNLPTIQLQELKQQTLQLTSRLQWASRQQVSQQKQTLFELNARLNALNPENILSRGYAWVTDSKGRVVNSTKQLRAGQSIQAQFSDGRIQATVDQSEPDLLHTLNTPSPKI